MPNYKYEAFRQQVYREFLQGKRVQDVILEYNLSSNPNLEQNLPNRNIIYTWYKDYLQQNGQDLQSKPDLQSVNLQKEDQIAKEQSRFDNNTKPLQSVNKEKGQREITRNNDENNELLVIGGIIVGAVVLILSML
jgi:hypothetical protein